MSIEAIKEDIKALRGADVKIFGQPTTLADEVARDLIDIVDVLDELKKYEVTNLKSDEYNEETDEFCEKDFESVEQFLDYLDDLGDIEEVSAGNSYNWSAPVSNDFNYTVYKNKTDDCIYVDLSVHRYGDVRSNYTIDALLEFRSTEEFFEVLLECNKYIDLEGGYYAIVDILSDGIEVYDEEGDLAFTTYDIDDAEEKIKELVGVEEEV